MYFCRRSSTRISGDLNPAQHQWPGRWPRLRRRAFGCFCRTEPFQTISTFQNGSQFLEFACDLGYAPTFFRPRRLDHRFRKTTSPCFLVLFVSHGPTRWQTAQRGMWVAQQKHLRPHRADINLSPPSSRENSLGWCSDTLLAATIAWTSQGVELRVTGAGLHASVKSLLRSLRQARFSLSLAAAGVPA